MLREATERETSFRCGRQPTGARERFAKRSRDNQNKNAGLDRPDTESCPVAIRADSSGAFLTQGTRLKEEMAMAANDEKRAQHWAKTRNLTIVVLILWFIFAFVLPWNAKALNSYSFIGFPLGYYFIAQGSLIAFVLLIFIQNWFQDKIDDEFGMHEDE
jgi:putative solute:sodium symporter small subunit